MKKKILILTVLCFLFSSTNVNAVTVTSSSRYYFNRTTGAYSSTEKSGYGTDHVKKIGNNYAYCVNWHIGMGANHSKYAKDSSWNTKSKNAIIGGIIVENIAKDYSDALKRYHMTAATLNTYFSKALKDSHSRNFYSTNNTIKKIYDQAIKDYSSVNLSTSIDAPTIKLTDSVLNYISGTTYISDLITITGLKEYVGKDTDKVSYTITASSTKGTVEFCSAANGTNCQASINFSGRKADYPFYLKATGVDASDNITLGITGTNSSKYPTIIKYYYTPSKNGAQKLVTKDEFSVPRSTSQYAQLTIPNLQNHSINGYKVDEQGNLLSGSTLQIYKGDPNAGGTLLASNQNGASRVSYTSPTLASTDDDFFKHNYYLVETSAPDGYVLDSKNKQKTIYTYNPNEDINKNSSKCYYESGSGVSEADMERCNFASYEYKCLASTGGDPIDLSDKENCDFTKPDTGGETTGGSEGGNTGNTTANQKQITDDPDQSGTNGDVTPPSEPEKPKVTYEKICYNNTTKKKVDDETFCSEKDKYIKVSKSSGNLMVSKVNVKNSIKISKRAATGDDEVEGASLKICTSADYQSKKEKCDPAKTVSDKEMSWISGTSPVEFVGLKKGEYYIIEETPPSGYIITTTATPFSINEAGEVKSGNQTVKDNLIVIKNKLNTLKISKTDIATSKELPGATISICNTYEDEEGKVGLLKDQYDNECIPVILSDGKEATWTSTDQPKAISGLPAGTYYLVEKIAPKGYATAESILFTMGTDGKLTDKDGKSLADNKLVMHDKKIDEVKTGMDKVYKVVGICLFVVAVGASSYFYMNQKNHPNSSLKIRKRKIHKF